MYPVLSFATSPLVFYDLVRENGSKTVTTNQFLINVLNFIVATDVIFALIRFVSKKSSFGGGKSFKTIFLFSSRFAFRKHS